MGDFEGKGGEAESGRVRSSAFPSGDDGDGGGGSDRSYTAEDLRAPDVQRDDLAIMPWVDDDHDLVQGTAATSKTRKRRPTPRRTTQARKSRRPATRAGVGAPKPPATANVSENATEAPSASTTTATSTNTNTNAKPTSPKLADDIANMKAAMLNLELTTLRYSKDPNAKYKLGDILERADDSLTRKKLNEHHGTANKGQSLEAMVNAFEGLDDHAKKNAHSLISEKRDATTDKLAAMDPKSRAELEDKAAAWADQVMDITQAADRDDSEHSDKIASILGPRSPEEIEVIRSRMRLQTSGVKESQRTTLHEQLDRAFTGNDKDIALAGLSGNHAHVAARQLVDAASDNDPDRVHRIVKELSPEKLAELRQTNPVLLAQVASNMPSEQRAQIEAALGGRRGEAEGGRIESMLQPVDISVSDAHDIDKAKRKMAQKEAQDPERLIAEFERMSQTDLAEARKTHGESWDELIAARYKDADSTVRLRIEAAARGDKVGERALRLRQGMRTFDQNLIDQVLANPDLQSSDPTKKAAAEAERREIDARMRSYDATDQQTQALIDGQQAPVGSTGRSTQQQLDAYYERAKHHDKEASGLFEQVEHVANKDERMARTREKANVDKYAATEMWTEGDAHASTKVRRAELSGNTEQKAAILEKLDSKNKEGSTNTLASQAAEYSRKFGGRDMLAGPDLSGVEDIVKLVPGLSDGERSAQEIAAQLVRDDMNDGELRMQHVRETGVMADRSRTERVEQMKERRDNSHSGWLEGSEKLRHMRGGNRGSEYRLESAIALMEQGDAEGVDDREMARRDKSAVGALASQRDEKKREAEKIKQVLSIASKIAAILTANPALFVAVDAGFSALRIAAQEMIAGEAYEMTADLKHMAVDVIVNLATAKFAGLGKGAQAGTQAAKGAQMAQRVGNIAGAAGGAAAHSAIDGEDGGGAVLRAVLGALVPGYLRGKTEKAANATTRSGRLANDVVGGVIETGANVAIGGGAVDGTTAVDLVGGGLQGRLHGGRRPKATSRDHAAMATHSAADVDLPRRSTAGDDHIRRAAQETDPRHAQYARIEDHTREVETRRQAEAAYQAHAHFADDVDGEQAASSPAPTSGKPSHGKSMSSASGAGTPPTAAIDASRDTNDDGGSNAGPRRATDDAERQALVELSRQAKTPEERAIIGEWAREIDAKDPEPVRASLEELKKGSNADGGATPAERAALKNWEREAATLPGSEEHFDFKKSAADNKAAAKRAKEIEQLAKSDPEAAKLLKPKEADPELSKDIKGVLAGADAARVSEDPRLAALQSQRAQFETAVAMSPEAQAAVKPMLDDVAAKALDYLQKMHPDGQGGIDPEALKQLGKDPTKKSYAGAVGTDPQVLLEVMKNGNVRERMVALSEFQEKILGADALAATSKGPEGEAARAKMEALFGAEDNKTDFTKSDFERLMDRTAEYRNLTEKQGGKIEAKGVFNPAGSEHDAYWEAKGQNMDAKLHSFTAAAMKEQMGIDTGGKDTGIGEGNVLARAAMTIEEAQALGLNLSEREIAAANQRTGGTGELPWVMGSKANMVDPDAPFIKGAKDQAMPLKAGISGTTARGMGLFDVMGMDPELARLALMTQLQPIEAHSWHEIASAANGYMASDRRYEASNPYATMGLPPEALRAVAERNGMSIDHLSSTPRLQTPKAPDAGRRDEGARVTPTLDQVAEIAEQPRPMPRNLEEAIEAKRRGETFSNKEVREDYNSQNQKIGEQNEEWKRDGVGAEERARRASEKRHEMRMTSRELMDDNSDKLGLLVRDAKKYGDGEGPDFEMVVAETKRKNPGLDGDALFEKVIAGTQRTDKKYTKDATEEPANKEEKIKVTLPEGVTVHGDVVRVPNLSGEEGQTPIRIQRDAENGPTRFVQNEDGTYAVLIGKDAESKVALVEVADQISNLVRTTRGKRS